MTAEQKEVFDKRRSDRDRKPSPAGRRGVGVDRVLSGRSTLEGKTLEQIAESRKRPAGARGARDDREGAPSIVSFNMSEADIVHLMQQPYTMTSSDGGLGLPTEGKPHPRNYGAFARKLALYVRERGAVTLEHAIRSMTSLPATVFGMHDRGVIREGAAADILIFDPAEGRGEVHLRRSASPRRGHDLRAGERRRRRGRTASSPTRCRARCCASISVTR